MPLDRVWPPEGTIILTSKNIDKLFGQLCTLYKQNHILLCLASFIYYYVFEIHSHVLLIVKIIHSQCKVFDCVVIATMFISSTT